MKLCIVTQESNAPRKKEYIASGKKYFTQVLGVSLNQLRVEAGEEKPTVMYKNTDLSTFDVVFFRAHSQSLPFSEMVLDILESNGVYVPNSIDGLQMTCHKYHSVMRVARIGVAVPDTSLAITPEAALQYSERFGFPLILKLLRGFGGRGVMMIRTKDELKPILDTISVFDEFLSSQKYVPNAGEDLRTYVIGDEVIGIKRKGAENEWRANVSTGGTATFIEVPEALKETSRRIAQLIGLEIAGIDFIESEGDYVFIEANFTAGYLPTMFGTELLDKMMEYLYHETVERAKQ
ncbi:MAG: ATP-grasp domain-containing protein [Candidatus Woesearchaeota archaeon]